MRNVELVKRLMNRGLSRSFRRSVLTSIADREPHSGPLLAGIVQQSGARTRVERAVDHIQNLSHDVGLDTSTANRIVDRVKSLSPRQFREMKSREVREVNPQRSDNMICGRVGEQLLLEQFADWTSARLTNHTDQHHFFDMTLEYDDGSQLLVNAKTFSRRFDHAQRHVGLSSDDAIALATYKILGMADREPDAAQAIITLPMWNEAQVIRDLWITSLPEPARSAWEAVRAHAVPRSGVEDQFLRAYLDPLALPLWNDAANGQNPKFRVCSVARALHTLLTCPKRTPAISSPGRYNTQPNVHLSLMNDMVSLDDFRSAFPSSSSGYPSPGSVRNAIPHVEI